MRLSMANSVRPAHKQRRSDGWPTEETRLCQARNNGGAKRRFTAKETLSPTLLLVIPEGQRTDKPRMDVQHARESDEQAWWGAIDCAPPECVRPVFGVLRDFPTPHLLDALLFPTGRRNFLLRGERDVMGRTQRPLSAREREEGLLFTRKRFTGTTVKRLLASQFCTRRAFSLFLAPSSEQPGKK